MSAVVDLTLDSDDEGPLFSRLARRISPLRDSRATKPGRSPSRQPLSPVQGNSSPRLQGWGPARGLAAESAAAGGWCNGLGAGPGNDAARATERDRFVELLSDVEPPAAAATAAVAPAAARPRRRRCQGGALAGLAGAFSSDLDLLLPAPAEPPVQNVGAGPGSQQQQQCEAGPSGKQQQQQQQLKVCGSAGSRGWAGALSPGGDSLGQSRWGASPGGPSQGEDAYLGGGPCDPARAAAAGSAAATAGGQWQAQQQAQRRQQPLPWEFDEGTQEMDAAELGDVDGGSEWMPGPSQPADADDDAAKKKRRGKKTEEEKAQEAAEKDRVKAQKAAERQRIKEQKEAEKARLRAAKKQTKQYGSKDHALKWITVLLDPRLMNTPMGLKIAETLQEVQSKAGDKGVSTDVRSCGLEPYRAIKWLRKDPQQQQQQFEESQQSDMLGGTESQQGMGPLVDVEMPHVMICMQPEEFVQEVQRNQLESLWDLLDKLCPGYNVFLTVCGLNSYMTTRERREGAKSLQAGSSELGFNRGAIDDFVAGLAINCPSLGFRDVVDTAQAGEHALCITKAVAQDPYKPNDATLWLGAHAKKDSQAWGQLLASQPIADKGVETLAKALYAMPVPSLNPGVAHAVASEYRSMGALISMLLDPSRSDRDKRQEIQNLQRTTTGKAMRVGPTAAKQLLELLTCGDPDMLIMGGTDAGA